MTRVLILGFSVTAERDGYADIARKRAAAEGIDVEVCGVGGVNPLPLPVIFEGLVRQHGPFDHVFLELATSIYGAQIKDWSSDGLDVLYDVFSTIQASGAELGLINLYRDDFDYPYHVFDMVLESLARRFEVPILDLASGLVKTRGIEFCRSLLRDTIHTNPSGSDFQADAVWNFVATTIRSGRKTGRFPSPARRRRAVSFVEACEALPSGTFARSGLSVRHTILGAGEACSVAVPRDAKVSGFSFLSGPLSGDFRLEFAGTDKIEVVQAFDEHCYYERYNYRRFNPISCKAVNFRQLSHMPQVKLRKGEMKDGERIGKPVALHYFVER